MADATAGAELCAICMESPATAIAAPCGHQCACYKCLTDVARSATPVCPICRAPIMAVVPRAIPAGVPDDPPAIPTPAHVCDYQADVVDYYALVRNRLQAGWKRVPDDEGFWWRSVFFMLEKVLQAAYESLGRDFRDLDKTAAELNFNSETLRGKVSGMAVPSETEFHIWYVISNVARDIVLDTLFGETRKGEVYEWQNNPRYAGNQLTAKRLACFALDEAARGGFLDMLMHFIRGGYAESSVRTLQAAIEGNKIGSVHILMQDQNLIDLFAVMPDMRESFFEARMSIPAGRVAYNYYGRITPRLGPWHDVVGTAMSMAMNEDWEVFCNYTSMADVETVIIESLASQELVSLWRAVRSTPHGSALVLRARAGARPPALFAGWFRLRGLL